MPRHRICFDKPFWIDVTSVTVRQFQAHGAHAILSDEGEKTIHKYCVEGADPGVALRSTVYPDQDIVLPLIGNTQDDLWPLCQELETMLEENR